MEKRSAIIAAVRGFFVADGFLEVETPTVVPVPGMEPHLDPFQTEIRRHDGAKFTAHLIASPEYSMKKLLAGGLTKIFELARAYRNSEPWDGSHNAEFTMLEWYRADASYEAIMADTERMVAGVAKDINGTEQVTYQGQNIDLSAPWPRMSVVEAFQKYAGIDLGAGIDDPAKFRRDVEAKGVTLTANDTWDDAFFKIFLRDIEPKLGMSEGLEGDSSKSASALDLMRSLSLLVESPSQPLRPTLRPVILYEYPRSMAALARLKAGDTRFAERFEAYVGGMELANAFSELNDAAEQRRRLEEERAQRNRLGALDYGLDEQFLEAVSLMPPSAGIALGIDRLVMLFTDSIAIKDVLFFPSSDLFE